MPSFSLKSLNIASLVSLVVICLTVAWVCAYGVDQLKALKNLIEFFGGIIVIAPLVMLLTNLVPADIKHMLVFCRIKNVLPGHRFIRLIERDSRLAMGDVVNHFSGFNVADMVGEQQNSFWYREIYQPNQDDSQIKSAHKAFLLYRDAGTSVLFLSLITFLLSQFEVAIVNTDQLPIMSVTLLAESAVLLFAASIAGKRMVTTAVCVKLTK